MPDVHHIAIMLMKKPAERDKIDTILDRPDIREAVDRPRDINRKYDVPYLAGSSKEGDTTYIDRRLPEKCKVGDDECDVAPYLNTHEQTEHALMKIGKMPYEDAHSIATQKEREHVEKDGYSWDDYEHTMDGYLDKTEHEKPENPPPDLYVKPYPHDKAKIMQRAEEKKKAKTTPAEIAKALMGREK